MKTILAIDPGASGGLAYRHGAYAAVAFPMPDTEGELLEVIREITIRAEIEKFLPVAVIENQTGCVGIKVSAPSMFKFGRGFGFMIGALQALGWRIELVNPQAWQKGFSLGTKASAGGTTPWKNKLKTKAAQLYPCMKITLATADALLLLEYWHQKSQPEAAA